MSEISPKDFKQDQAKALEDLERTALIRAAVEIVSTDSPKEGEEQRAELKRKFEALERDIEPAEPATHLLGLRGAYR
jgi:hypothetical protein